MPGEQKNLKMYYFGCIKYTGHYLWEYENSYNLKYTLLEDGTIPWGFDVDSRLCHNKNHTEENGLCIIHEKNNWTAMSWWDNSIDKRPDSSSTFIVEGTGFSFEQLIELFKGRFPGVFNRQLCALQLHEDKRK